MTQITICDECGQVVYNSRDEKRYRLHSNDINGKTICHECDPPNIGHDISYRQADNIESMKNDTVGITSEVLVRTPTVEDLELKTREALAIGDLHMYHLGYFQNTDNVYYMEISAPWWETECPHDEGECSCPIAPAIKDRFVDNGALLDFVTIVAKNIEHAKKYYEVCFAKWREINNDPMKNGHSTTGIEWIGTATDGYAVLPDDYECNCRECIASEKTEIVNGHPNLKVFYSEPNEIGLNYSIEKWDDKLECENCGRKGSYFIANDKNSVGVCLKDLQESTGEGKYFKAIEVTEQSTLDEDAYDGIMCYRCEKNELCDYDKCHYKHCDKCTEFKMPKKEYLRYHCMNPTCCNFTSSHDLSGTWCQAECFIEFESGEPRITRDEYLQMIVDYGWHMDDDEKREADEFGIEWRTVNRCPTCGRNED